MVVLKTEEVARGQVEAQPLAKKQGRLIIHTYRVNYYIKFLCILSSLLCKSILTLKNAPEHFLE